MIGEHETVLDLGSDIHLRLKWFTDNSFAHPAKLHLGLVEYLVQHYTRPGDTIADPMAGIGSTLLAAANERRVIAREIEPNWFALLTENVAHIRNQAGLFVASMDVGQADAREPWGYTTDHILFSPPYGCEASTKANPRRGLPYKIRENVGVYDRRWQRLVDHPTPGSIGSLAFHYGTTPEQIGHFRGKRYWQAMEQVYTQAYAALRGGYMMVVVKDHIHKGVRVATADQTIKVCEGLGFILHERLHRIVFPLSLWQRRRKEAGQPIVEDEDILIFTKGRAA